MRFDAVPRELLQQCQRGDLQAFETLCEAVQPDLYAFVLSLLRDHDDAADVCQECLVRTFRSLPRLRQLERFPAWIMKLAVNQCHTARSRRHTGRVISLEEGPAELESLKPAAGATPPQSPREASITREACRHLNAAIAQLPPRQRSAIILFEVEQMSVRQVSEVLDCSEGAVKFNLHEARKKLKVALEALEQPLQREVAR